MSPWAVYSLCVVSGICLYAGFNHLQITLGRHDQRAHQVFALICFNAAAIALLTVSIRWVATPEEIVSRVRVALGLVCLIGVFAPWLVAEYTQAESRWLPKLLSVIYVGFFILNLALPYGLWLTSLPPPESAHWSPAERVVALMQNPSPWRLLFWSTHLLTFGYTFWQCFRQYRRGEKYRAIALSISMTILLATLVNNALISIGHNLFPFLGHFGFLSLIFLMSLSLGHEIRQSDRRMRAVLDQVPALIYVKDRSGRFLFANRHLRSIFGSNDTDGSRPEPLRADAFDHAWRANDDRVFAANQPCTVEETVQHNGDIRSYLSLKFPLSNKRGRPHEIGSVSTGITEQKQIQRALALQEAQLRLLIDSTEQGILGIDLEGRCTHVNRTCLNMMGYTESRALLGKRVARLLLHLGPNATQSQEIIETVKRTLSSGERGHSEKLKCYRTDGSWFHAEYWCQPIWNQNRIEGVVISILDITERRRVTDAIRALAEASATEDSAAFFNYCVRSLAQLYGVRYGVLGLLDDSRTRIKTEAIWAGDRIVENREFELAHSPCEDIQGLTRHLISEGVVRLFPNDVLLARANIESYFVTPVVASNGQTIGVLVLLGDEALQVGPASESIIDIFANRISVELERKAALEEISELNTSLERRVTQRTAALSQSNDELEAFSYSVSHDLRAPLTAIQGFAALLLRHYTNVLDNSGQHYLQRIVEGSRRMGELIDGLLTLAHITRQPLQRRDLDLAALSGESLRLLREGDPLRRVHFECASALHVTGDHRLLQALVHNLMDNAWKYTSRTADARIEVGSFRIGNEAVYFVRDNGVGFDGAQSDRLFQPFRRLHDPKQFRGTGIGLATAARIVRRHGGRIWAEGRPDQGATFYFTLPETSRQAASSEPKVNTTLL